MANTHTRKVLVVEDNELNMRLFCDLLDAYGFETYQCRDGAKAVEIARSEQPDLIIMEGNHVAGNRLKTPCVLLVFRRLQSCIL